MKELIECMERVHNRMDNMTRFTATPNLDRHHLEDIKKVEQIKAILTLLESPGGLIHKHVMPMVRRSTYDENQLREIFSDFLKEIKGGGE